MKFEDSKDGMTGIDYRVEGRSDGMMTGLMRFADGDILRGLLPSS